MKKTLMIVCVALTALWSFSALANNRIGVVNMQKLIQDSPQVRALGQKLKQKFSSRRNKVLAMSKELQTLIAQYQKNKAVMSAKELQALKTKITTKETALRTAQVKLQQEMYQAQNQAMTQFVSKLRGVVKTIAKKKNLDMVLPQNTVLYSGNTTDITSDVAKSL